MNANTFDRYLARASAVHRLDPRVKVVAAVAVMAVAGPWMLTLLVEYIQRTLMAIPTAVG